MQGANLTFADGHVEHWRWRCPKIFRQWVQFPVPDEEKEDLRRLQSCIPPLKEPSSP
jgi:prepilin-type processing-associated H-X9-DG protein